VVERTGGRTARLWPGVPEAFIVAAVDAAHAAGRLRSLGGEGGHVPRVARISALPRVNESAPIARRLHLEDAAGVGAHRARKLGKAARAQGFEAEDMCEVEPLVAPCPAGGREEVGLGQPVRPGWAETRFGNGGKAWGERGRWWEGWREGRGAELAAWKRGPQQ
jgi:hypothetical protein